MPDLKCPNCGRVFKNVEMPVGGNVEEVVIHCNKCNMDIKFKPKNE